MTNRTAVNILDRLPRFSALTDMVSLTFLFIIFFKVTF